jgi:hypothetical protein
MPQRILLSHKKLVEGQSYLVSRVYLTKVVDMAIWWERIKSRNL